MIRFLLYPVFYAAGAMALFSLSGCMSARPGSAAAVAVPDEAKPFQAQVVGLQWLNPLQRRDYPTEWQLLWTLGQAQPNKDDDMVKSDPKTFSKIQAIGIIANGNDGAETLKGFHHKYVDALTVRFHKNYFSSSTYFYNAHSLKDKSTWRELAGIHVEYALPEGRLDAVEAAAYTRERIIDTFDIGNPNFPKAWSRSTPPDVRVTSKPRKGCRRARSRHGKLRWKVPHKTRASRIATLATSSTMPTTRIRRRPSASVPWHKR